MTAPDNERLAVLEEQHERLQKDIEELFKFIREHMEKEEDRWKDIHDTLTKWKGFIGGALFIITALWGVLTFLGKFFFK